MADTIKPGAILITEGALLPKFLLLESEPYAYGWRLVKNLDSNGLDQIISQASEQGAFSPLSRRRNEDEHHRTHAK